MTAEQGQFADDKLAEGHLKRIHVDRQIIAERGPNPVTIQTSVGPLNVAEIEICGPCKVIYCPEEPMPYASLWIETEAEVRIIKFIK